MATENTTHITTFTKGMDSDTSDMYLDSQSYRYADNLRITADVNGTSGELTMINGSDLKYTIALLTKPEVLALASVLNVGVILVKHEYNGNVVWSVFKYTDWSESELAVYWGSNVVLAFGPCTEPICNNFTAHPSLLLNKENDNTIKLYIADGEHALMCINISDTSTIYTDIQNILSLLGGINDAIYEVLHVQNGLFEYGVVLYVYRTYDDDGRFSAISAPTQKYAICNIKTISNGSHIFYGPDLQSNMTIKVTVKKPELYNNILLFRILYKENNTTPTILLIADRQIKEDFTFNDSGQVSLAEYTLEELLNGLTTRIVAKYLATKNNYLFLANIKYESDLLYSDWDARSYSVGSKIDGVSVDLSNIPQNVSEYATITHDNLDLSLAYDYSKWHRSDPADTHNGIGLHVNWKYIFEDVPIPYFSSISCTLSDDLIYSTSEAKEVSFQRKTLTLKRDEIYRYGIVLYSESGAKSNVKWIADIRTPDCNREPIVYIELRYDTRHWNARVLGIQFLVYDLPEDCIAFEIVRAKRTIDDKRSLSQGVIAATVMGSAKTNSDDESRWDKYNISSSGIPLLSRIVWGSSKFYGGQSETDHQSAVNTISSTNKGLDVPGLSIAKTDIDVIQYYSPETCYDPIDFQNLVNGKILNLSPAQQILWEYSTYETSLTEWKTSKATTANNINPGSNNSNLGKIDTRFLHIPTVLDLDTFVDPLYPGLVFDYDRPYNATIVRTQTPSDYPDYLTIKEFLDVVDKQLIRINEFSVVSDLPRWNSFVEEDTLLFRDHVQVLGNGYTYNKWCMPEQKYLSDSDIKQHYKNTSRIYGSYPVGISGRSALLYSSNFKLGSNEILNIFNTQEITIQPYFKSLLVDICQTGVNPYGGTSISALNNTTYISNGNFYKTEDVYEDEFAEVNVYDGDYFIQPFEFVSRYNWYSIDYNYVSRIPQVCMVPVETSIDLFNSYGAQYSRLVNNGTDDEKMKATWMQDLADAVVALSYDTDNGTYDTSTIVLSESMYKYHSAYSLESAILYSAQNVRRNNVYNYPHRVASSLQKTSGETIDSWMSHSLFNYIDVDINHGSITNISTFENKLLFLQEHAFGELSVNEKAQVIDENNHSLLLGTGGVLDRYDYINTNAGLKDGQRATNVSKSAFYWWDAVQLSINRYGVHTTQLGQSRYTYSDISQNKISSFLKQTLENDSIIDDPQIYIDNPTDEVLFHISEDGCVVYNELVLQFNGVYNIYPASAISFKDNLYLLYAKQSTINIERWNECHTEGFSSSDEIPLTPSITYVVNKLPMVNKVFDNVEFYGKIHNGGDIPHADDGPSLIVSTLDNTVKFYFNTPLNLTSNIDGAHITNREYEYRFAVPRSGNTAKYGNRLRGKTMLCTMMSTSNDINFSLQYIITKFRTSWT